MIRLHNRVFFAAAVAGALLTATSARTRTAASARSSEHGLMIAMWAPILLLSINNSY